MASLTEKPPQTYNQFFEHHIQQALTRWAQNEAVQKIDITILDQEQENILSAINLGLSLPMAWPAVKTLVVAFTRYMERRGHWPVWNRLLHRALTAAQNSSDVDGEITLMSLLGRLYQRQSQPEEVIYYYRRVIRLARQTSNQFEMARACSNLGYTYIDRGQWWRSEVLSCSALAVFEALGSDHGRAHTHNHLGVLYIRQVRLEEAEVQLQKACDIWLEMRDTHALIYGYENLGLLYIDMNKPDKALLTLKKSLQQIEVSGESSEIGTIWLNIGVVYMRLGDYEEAADYLFKAERLYLKRSNLLGVARTWGYLGLVCKNEEALDYMEKSLKAHRRLKNINGEVKALIDIIEYELDAGDRLAARRYINDLEKLINQPIWGNQVDDLRRRLKGYYRRLSDEEIGKGEVRFAPRQ